MQTFFSSPDALLPRALKMLKVLGVYKAQLLLHNLSHGICLHRLGVGRAVAVLPGARYVSQYWKTLQECLKLIKRARRQLTSLRIKGPKPAL